jgi:hypothetical protein
MYAMNGFITIGAFANNTPGVTSPIGEISNAASSYSRELGFYSSVTTPDVKLVSFSSLNDGTKIAVAPTYVDPVLLMAQWLYNRSLDGSLSDDREDCRQSLITQFGTTLEIVRVGNMVSNGTYWLPEQISITVKSQPNNLIKLWFSDAAFKSQYDLFEIVVVPPHTPVDDFHGSRASVLTLVSEISVTKMNKKVDLAIGNFPPTDVVSEDYDWVDKNDPGVTRAVPWVVLVYGNAGNNADVIREAIITHVLANSVQPRTEWEKIFPDLFLPNEFYITPLWDRFSLPQQQTVAGIYSPTVGYSEIANYALSTFVDTPWAHARDNLTTSTANYKSLLFISVGNPRNRDGIFNFQTLWPKYAAINVMSTDFNRIPPATQEFIVKLQNMFIQAESLTEYSTVPSGFTRVKRGINWYLAMNHQKMQYLMSFKSNPIFEHEDPAADPASPQFKKYTLALVHGGANSGVTAEVFEVDSQGALLPIAGGTIVTWEAYWYNADGTLRETKEILSGTAEELLFATNSNTYGGSRIAVVAKFNDRQVTKTIEVVAS